MSSEHDKEDIEERIKRYLSPERREELDFLSITSYIPIEPDQHVADIGCGPGFFSIPLAKLLIYGKLYALDIEERMLEVLRRRVRETKLGNVEILLSKEAEFPLDEQSVDGVFMAFVLHKLRDRVAFLRSCAHLLKPRSWCTVLEWFRKETDQGPPMEHRIEPEELRNLARLASLDFRWWRTLNDDQYMALMHNRLDVK